MKRFLKNTLRFLDLVSQHVGLMYALFFFCIIMAVNSLSQQLSL